MEMGPGHLASSGNLLCPLSRTADIYVFVVCLFVFFFRENKFLVFLLNVVLFSLKNR